ncbi:MAG: hypothetical protein HOQ22_05180 [Nocardioidaceae bacterium]|nr:hypothetical protein [Nocardioidaceae bacterium]NUS50420.1 hypothetical protein [Nocardioidaceae bacterium]
MQSIPIRPARQAGVLSVLLVLSVAGCGGDELGGDPSTGGSATPDACNSLAAFDNTFQATVTAVSNGQGTQAVQGSVASLKDQYIQVGQELPKADPQAAADLTAAMTDLSNAVARLPQNASKERISTSLQPHVDKVDQAVGEAEKSLNCPT